MITTKRRKTRFFMCLAPLENKFRGYIHFFNGKAKGITWLNNLKLRAGFGITGVIPNDPYMS